MTSLGDHVRPGLKLDFIRLVVILPNIAVINNTNDCSIREYQLVSYKIRITEVVLLIQIGSSGYWV